MADVGQHQYCIFPLSQKVPLDGASLDNHVFDLCRGSLPFALMQVVLNLGTTDIVDWVLFCCRAVLCPVGHLKATLTSIPYMLVPPLTAHPVVTIIYVSRLCQMSHMGRNCSQLRITALKLADTLGVRVDICKHASELNEFGKLWALR